MVFATRHALLLSLRGTSATKQSQEDSQSKNHLCSMIDIIRAKKFSRMRIMTVAVLVIVTLMFVGCSQYEHEEPIGYYQEKVPLKVWGCGYEIGDVALVDTEKVPEIGDIVLYDARINRCDCMAFGPGVYLAKIIGLPGDEVSFSEYSYEANGYIVTFEREYESHGVIYKRSTKTKNVMWGNDTYENVSNMQLTVPNSEYLADEFIGYECPPGEYNEYGSIAYNRFTIKREAIKGVVLRKVGHDKEFEEYWKNVVY